MKYKIALIIGRFQPFHNGHLYLLKKALSTADKIIFGIGSASIYDENNPLSYEQRILMIETVMKNEKISDRIIKIVPLEDFYNDEKWLENIHRQVGRFDVAMGNNSWTNKVLKKAGYKVIRINHYKRYLFEGWRIRKLIKENKKWQDRVPKYIVPWLHDFIAKNNNGTMKQFNNIVLGGTFDRLHAGHKTLISKAFELGKKVTIGITTEKLYKNKFLSETIEPFSTRKENIKKYINKQLQDDRTITNYKIIPISDIYGSAGNDGEFDAIVVSKETYPNALAINRLREKNHLPLLRIVIVADILANDGKLVRSERIRAGEIDRSGKNYLDFFKKTLIISETFKEELRKPMGKIYKNEKSLLRSIDTSKYILIIAVGDIIVNSLHKAGVNPNISIIDYKSRRKPIDNRWREKRDPDSVEATYWEPNPGGNEFATESIINNAGTVNVKAAKEINLKIKKFVTVKKPQTIIIDGEEDLLALPAILFAPLNSLILYGHWQYGIIAVSVNEDVKNKVVNMLNKFV